MLGNQFDEFDETGESLCYFYLFWGGVYLLVLIPVTILFWPNKKDLLESNQHFTKSSKSNINRKRKFINIFKRVICLIAWIIFFWLAYNVSQNEMESTEFDPFTKYGISEKSSKSEIRRAYKRLSLKYHPDKGGSHKHFIRLTEIYSDLIDKKSRNKWKTYSNPIKPKVIRVRFGKWFVDKKGSILVLVAYFFILGLPIFLLWKCVPRNYIKNRKIPFVANFKVKGGIFINSHTRSIPFKKDVIVKKCSFQVNDMISIVAQFVAILHHSNTIHNPQWKEIKYNMKLNEFDVRSFPGKQSPFMQLPPFKECIFRYFVTRERNIPGIKQLEKMEKKDCHDLLGPFSDNKYSDLIHESSSIQLITLQCEVMNNKYSTSTLIINITANIIRKPTVFLLPQGKFSIKPEWSNQDLFWFSDDQKDGTLYSSMSVPTEVYISEANLSTVIKSDYQEIYEIKLIPFFESQS